MERNDNKVCRVDVSSNKFNICTKEQDYGYSKSSPCVFLKLNKVKAKRLSVEHFRWTQILSDLQLESRVLQQIERIARFDARRLTREGAKGKRQRCKLKSFQFCSSHDSPTLLQQNEMIWISCEGENPADIENLGPVNYFPQRGFPGYYYPYVNQRGYQAPIIAINFERPKSKTPRPLTFARN